MDKFKSNKMREARRQKHITQKKLGEMLGISDRAVSKWELGLSKPSGQNLIRLAKLLEVPVEAFFDDSGYVKTKEETVCGMESLTELYKVGRGPSSSHTIGPEKACMIFKEKNKEADRYKAILYGSLAKTGKGHCTDEVIKKTFLPYDCEVEFNYVDNDIPHPSTLELISYKKDAEIERVRVFSVGGGSIAFENDVTQKPERIYELNRFSDIAKYCEEKNIRLWQYAIENEGEDFLKYMFGIWEAMKASVKNGLADTGKLPGGLDVEKKAKSCQ